MELRDAPGGYRVGYGGEIEGKAGKSSWTLGNRGPERRRICEDNMMTTLNGSRPAARSDTGFAGSKEEASIDM